MSNRWEAVLRVGLLSVAVATQAACSSGAGADSAHTTTAAGGTHTIQAVGAEDFYANVIAQIGGQYVTVHGILDNPNTDPHSFESSTADASLIESADLIVQNGVGYDPFMDKLESASPNSKRTVIDVGQTLGFKAGDNPHLWYRTQTMPIVAKLIADDLSRRDPAHAHEFEQNRQRFVQSLQPWVKSLAALHKQYASTPIAVTEPVFNWEADAVGVKIETPESFQLAVEEGNDPAPQDVAKVRSLLATHAVRAFVYNQQTVEPTTQQLLDVAHQAHVPVIGVYETMPKGLTYQTWMLAEVNALQRALHDGQSTESLH